MNPHTTDEAVKCRTTTEVAPRVTTEPGLGRDLLCGADAIAEFLFGDSRQRRKVYYLTSEGRTQLPHFRLGTIICARKSTLLLDRGRRGARFGIWPSITRIRTRSTSSTADSEQLEETDDGEQLVPVWFATHSDDEWHWVPPDASPPAQDLMMHL